jgi:drug/metabolite transporter (DMT)-like permease
MTDATAARPAIRWLPLILLVVLGALWGANPAFSKALAIAGVSPFSVVFWQTFGAGLLLLLACLVRRTTLRFGIKHLIYFAFMGVVGIDVSYVTLVFTVERLSASYVSVLVLFSPMLTYVIALALRMEPVVRIRAVGIVVGLVGAGVLVIPEGSLPAPDLLPLALLAFLTPLGYASANVFAEFARPPNTDNVALAMGTMFAAALGALVAGLIGNSFYPAWESFGHIETVLSFFALSTAVAFLIFYAIIIMAGAVYLGQVGYLVTLFGVFWGILFFGEQPSAWLWVAVVLVAVGVALVNMGKPKPTPNTKDAARSPS